MSNFPEHVQVYLVGGAVRDQLLGLPIKDRDYVVVGASPELMIKLGFKPVGQDFPVFLHPKTGEEYALARTERKTGQGYQGFSVDFSSNVTLKEDLSRRDLTINALAQDAQGYIHDPYHGQTDISQKVLRHVSDAFVEDPLRVLRLARFHAKLAPLGFTIDTKTWQLVEQMVKHGELDYLTAERIWLEITKALDTDAPTAFFQDLFEMDAIYVLGLPENLSTSTFRAMQSALQRVSQRTQSSAIRFAAWLEPYPLGANAIVNQLPVPKNYQYWIRLFVNHASTLRAFAKATPQTRWHLFKQSGSLQAQGHVLAFAHALALPEPTIDQLQACLQRLQVIKAQTYIAQGLQGQALGEAIKSAQLDVLNGQGS